LILKNDSRLWCRQIEDNDFLDIRLGIGNKPAELVVEAPQEQFTLDEDNLFQEVYKIVDETKILKDVPITFSLLEKTNISFVFNSDPEINISIISLRN
jgi:S-DNA-T family DNA segregation ATPase FtsK/SpoIIIE